MILSVFLHAAAGAQTNPATPTAITDSMKQQMVAQREANKKAASKTTFTYFVIKAGDGATYGYDIYSDGNLLVHQPSVPAMPGNAGFSDTTSAGKTARFVIEKIRQGEMPPTVSEEELKKLGVIPKK